MSSLIYHTRLIRVISSSPNHCIESTCLLSSSNFFILNLSLSLTNWTKQQFLTSQQTKLSSIQIQMHITHNITLTSINFVISCTFSLFLSLKASRASLYSFSCKTSKTRFQCCLQSNFTSRIIGHFVANYSTSINGFWEIQLSSPSSGRRDPVALILCLRNQSFFEQVQLLSSLDLPGLQVPDIPQIEQSSGLFNYTSISV